MLFEMPMPSLYKGFFGKNTLAYLVLGLLLTACRDKTLFTCLPAEKTGITFANRITENDSINVFDFEYTYNGAGVGIGDFNNDSLPDVFFAGNQVSNRLFLNRGDMRFEDVSPQAGIAVPNRWCTGVSVVDINADGWADVYVCASVSKSPERRRNLLFINQKTTVGGVPTFREMAAEYGIADEGHSTSAAFFDYDNDGDLDLYVLTNEMEPERYPNNYHFRLTDGSSPKTDRLYRNDGPDAALGHVHFSNVSKQAGITYEGYGLGLNICDINRDGLKDIYVTNDYLSEDLLYINNGDGTFTNRAADFLKHTSSSAMGMDVADINNDGLADIVALDMLPEDNYRKKMFLNPASYQTYIFNQLYHYQHQYVRNTLQLNRGRVPGSRDLIFSEISLLAGIAETDWSWTPLVADFDQDGYRDILVTNGYPRDITDHDFVAYRADVGSVASRQMMSEAIPEVRIKNYAFHNNADLTFANTTDAWGLTQPSFSSGAAYADFDNDGDLDWIVSNINDSAFVYRNNLAQQRPQNAHFLRVKFVGQGQNPGGLGAMLTLRYGKGQRQVYEHTPYRGYMSSVEAAAHFGLGEAAGVTELVVTWPNGKTQRLRNLPADRVLTLRQAEATETATPEPPPLPTLFTEIADTLRFPYRQQEPDYIDFNVQKTLPHKFSQFGPSMAVADVNGDGLDDFFLGGGRKSANGFLLQKPDGAFSWKTLEPGTDARQSEDAGALLFDADADGFNDLYIVSGGYERTASDASYQDRFFRNDGKGHFSLVAAALPAETLSGSCVKAADFDLDGDLDLFIGGRVVPEQYPKPTSSRLLRNDSRPGVPKFTDVTARLAPMLLNLGMVCDALWTDADGDHRPDLLLAGEYLPLTLLKNEKAGFSAPKTGLENFVGLWNSLAPGDFDNDGDMDYLAGNLGLNSLLKASPQQPISLYARDFDGNGSYDVIPTVFYQNAALKKRVEVPYHVRDDMVKQIIGTRAKAPNYKTYAAFTAETFFTTEEKQDALVLRASYLQSALLINDGKGGFSVKALPTEAQFAPVFGMLADDFDGDGNLDALLVGNDFGNELYVGRYDALNGLLLRGDGRGGLKAAEGSGFFVPGDAKALVSFANPRGQYCLTASQNRDRLRCFGLTTPRQALRLRPEEVSAVITCRDGKKRKAEFPKGSSFYSQAAPLLVLTPNVRSVSTLTVRGPGRTLSF